MGTNNYFDAGQLLKSEFAPVYAQWVESLAALASFALAPVLATVLAGAAVVKLALVIAVLVFARHHANIRRLIAGTEPRIGQKA